MGCRKSKEGCIVLTSIFVILMIGCGTPDATLPQNAQLTANISGLKRVHYTTGSDSQKRVVTTPRRTQTNGNAMAMVQLGCTGANALWINEALATLNYLPLQFTPARGAAISVSKELGSVAISTILADQLETGSPTPIPGRWAWNGSYPTSLVQLWNSNTCTVLTQGAIMRFQEQHGMTVDGIASSLVYRELLESLKQNRVNHDPYVYVALSKEGPERLDVWEGGQKVFTSLANTGIQSSPTPKGTWPIYMKLPSQTMQGKSPDGQKYVDPNVPWIDYFCRGCAIHGFQRASYGSPQSLGCIELPVPAAEIVYHYVDYGTLVTVQS